MNQEERIDELKHFGVKGMKWGRRRAQSPQTTANRKAVGDTLRKVGNAKPLKAIANAGKGASNIIKDRVVEEMKYNINRATHPIASMKSDFDDIGNGSNSRAIRIGLVGRSTKELKSMNARTKKIVMDARAKKLKKQVDRAKQNELLKKWADEVDNMESKGMDYKTAVRKADANLNSARKKAGLGDTMAEKITRKAIGASAAVSNRKKKIKSMG